MESKSRSNTANRAKNVSSRATITKLYEEKAQLVKNIALLEKEQRENSDEIAKLNRKQRNLSDWIKDKSQKLERTNSLIIQELEHNLNKAKAVIRSQVIHRPIKRIIESNKENLSLTKRLKHDHFARLLAPQQNLSFPAHMTPYFDAGTPYATLLQQQRVFVNPLYYHTQVIAETTTCKPSAASRNVNVSYEDGHEYISSVNPMQVNVPTNTERRISSTEENRCFTQVSPKTVVNTSQNVAYDLKSEIKFLGYTLLLRVMSVLKAAETYELKQNEGVTFSFVMSTNLFFYLSEYKQNNARDEFRIILRLRGSPQQLLENGHTTQDNLQITVNGVSPFKSKNKKQSFETPIDITMQCWDTLSNEISIEAGSKNVDIVVGVYFVRLISVAEALNYFEIKAEERLMVESLEAIQDMLYTKGEAKEIITLPLNCPLSKRRIINPCLGNECFHAQCFDLESFLEKNHKQFLWKCPICNQVVEELVRDKLLTHILTKVSLTCRQIEFNGKGEWNEVGYRNVKHMLSLN